WTGEKMCMVGDSAGGNLIMSVNLRLIELDIKKKPDGIVPVYTPFLFQYLPSPSRLLSVMDPLLHMGVVLRCVAAYTGGYGHSEKKEEATDSAGHKSLQEYVEQVQKSQRFDFAINSDPLHIHLSSTIFDNQLLNYLIKHPTTKDSLTVVDENGEVIEEGDDALLANPTIPEEKEKKRPGLLNIIGGNASSTVPNTPCDGNKGIPSSSSSHNFQSQAAQ
ncbi:hypothetical protein ANCDUO_25161, partial [Ancylostoma duodenale]